MLESNSPKKEESEDNFIGKLKKVSKKVLKSYKSYKTKMVKKYKETIPIADN